ncbi:MAG: ATP-grasp domain-containing protein [Patescibacteria group bacterium]|nr:ATP-grasp domain-containing protein [Patescibacteria group bacterium]
MNEVKVLVLDGHLPSALACVRSLSKHNIKVICGAERKSALALHSKFASEAWTYPSPLEDAEAYVQAIIKKLSTKGDRPVIYCLSDNTLLPLALHRDQIEAVGRLVLPEEKDFNIAFDKALTLKLAERLGVPIPLTFFIENQEGLESALGQLAYPCVIKPRHSCLWVAGKGIRGKTEIADNREQAKAIVERIRNKTSVWPLLQEKLTGQEYGVFGLWQNGEWRAKFAHQRLRSLDPMGGASCLRQSIAMSPDMAEYASKLMSELKWQGPAMVEFKLDKPNGTPKLMEINGRFWGSLALTIASNVDFPYLAYLQACGQPIETPGQYSVPVTARSFLADFANLLKVMKFGTKVGVSRLSALRSFIFPNQPNLVYDVESWNDLKPALWQVIDVVARKL